MELTKLKRIKNKGLPKFETGNNNLLGLYSSYIDNAAKQYVQDNYDQRVRTPITQSVHPKQNVEPVYKNGVLDMNPYKKVEAETPKNTINLNNPSQYMSFIGTAINSFNPGIKWNELADTTGSTQRNIGGFSYERKNPVDRDRIMSMVDAKGLSNTLSLFDQGFQIGQGAYDGGGSLPKKKNGQLPKFMSGNGAIVGTIAGTAGALIGLNGWAVSNEKAEREIAHANRILDRTNGIAKDGAASQLVYQDELLRYGNPQQMSLRNYCNGKLPKFNDGKRVRSAFGLVDAPQTAWGHSHEGMIQYDPNGNIIAISELPGSKHVDSIPIYEDEYTQIVPADQWKQMKKMAGYKDGKLPKFNKGTASMAAIPGVIGAISKMAMANSGIQTSNSYFRNPNSARAADILAGQHVSNYHIIPEMYRMLGKTMNNITNSGGYSGGQRGALKLQALNNLQNNYAKLDIQNQLQNNQYQANYANFLNESGEKDRYYRTNAYNRDLDFNSRSRANANKGWLSGLADLAAIAQQTAKSNNEWDMFEMMYKNYSDELAIKDAERKAKQDQAVRLYNLYKTHPELLKGGSIPL